MVQKTRLESTSASDDRRAQARRAMDAEPSGDDAVRALVGFLRSIADVDRVAATSPMAATSRGFPAH